MNRLAKESSPYLQQHKNNPVDWYPWCEEAWQKAKQEDKLVLISIGYSACHWCHVMEKESFEDEATAAIMNQHFVCIKVDREERPDVDHVYMEAVQAITGSGGWPLNCFALPDGRPLHGGTYFRNEDWKKTLVGIDKYYRTKREAAMNFAEKLSIGVMQESLIKNTSANSVFNLEKLDSIVLSWQNYFDMTEGGQERAPKFPLPTNYLFLLDFSILRKNRFIMNFVHLTLHKMAWGGIYDQLGGGFARYSVDREWHAPHFEKMLYDNAQLVTLYSRAYRTSKNPTYLKVINETLTFIERELTNPNGGFYSALDADSEGVEGKFYCFAKTEIDALLGEKAAIYCQYYQITESGNWEETNILHRKGHDDEVAQQLGITLAELLDLIQQCNKKLFEYRSKRTRPGLDDKIITSWNALMISGYCEAYQATTNANYLERAITQFDFLLKNQISENGVLRIHKNGKSSINGFMDDYAFTIEAALNLYKITFNLQYIQTATQLAKISIADFYSTRLGLFCFTSAKDKPLFASKSEIYDNVIPSSNSVMASNLYCLSRLIGNPEWRQLAESMLENVVVKFATYPGGYTQWMKLQLEILQDETEIVIVGSKAKQIRKELDLDYFPSVLIAGTETFTTEIPLFQSRWSEGKTLIYFCKNNACQAPIEEVEELRRILKNGNR